MAIAATSQRCGDKGGGVGESSFAHLPFLWDLVVFRCALYSVVCSIQ